MTDEKTDPKLYFDVLTAATRWELDIKLQNFMHDKLIIREHYCDNGICGWEVHVIYYEL